MSESLTTKIVSAARARQQTPLGYSIQSAKDLVRFIKQGAAPRKVAILQCLERYGEMTVTDIYVKLRTEQCVVSQMLSQLYAYGFVHRSRQGKYIYYRINQDTMDMYRLMLEVNLPRPPASVS